MAEESIYDKAANAIAERAGAETDTDLITYDKLDDFNFRGLVRRYGFNNVARYIKLMESKKAGIPRLFGRN